MYPKHMKWKPLNKRRTDRNTTKRQQGRRIDKIVRKKNPHCPPSPTERDEKQPAITSFLLSHQRRKVLRETHKNLDSRNPKKKDKDDH